ncbi:hypothetical protein [Streptomyces otsuchiensis]|uniref:hypothetical protein n=1 Tax=Streptomyces otsuchiensis TaxID=2681388 RepID=UPI00102F87B9|nr:hypothetical protein [Streptomyces otsuchiensis]
MEFSEAEQRRLSANMGKVVVPGFVGAAAAAWYWGEDVLAFAQNWPGGVAHFMVTTMVLCGASLATSCALACMHIMPERTVPWLRMPGIVHVVALVVSLVTHFVTLVPVFLAMSGRGDVNCDIGVIYCHLREEEPSVLPLMWVAFGVTTAVGMAAVYFFTARERVGSDDGPGESPGRAEG